MSILENGFRIFTSDAYPIKLPAEHRFPFAKYALIREQLLYEGLLEPHHFATPAFISDELIHLAHAPAYWSAVKQLKLERKAFRKIGFPPSQSLVERTWCSASATFRATEQALRIGLGMSTSGGTHHAYRSHGEGYCVLNDVAIAAQWLLDTGRAARILVIDLDVHQGNGTARIFRHEPRVFTFSVHCRANYPLHKEQSDLDIALPPGTTDARYLQLLEQHLPTLLYRQKPAVVFYIAGADVLASDKLGKLALSRDGCRQRDLRVLQMVRQQEIPLVVTMGGGYARQLADIVTTHANTFKTALDVYDA